MSITAIAARLGVAMIWASLLGACSVAPYGAQVYLARVQQSQLEIAQSCEAGDQVACGLRPYVARAVAQAQEEASLPWR